MNLFIFHIHSITPRQSIPYPDIMTKDRHYQLGITVMTLISHNLHTQVIMVWLRKKFYFFKKDAEVQTKDAEVLGNTIPALMCLSGCMSDPLWDSNTVSPHIPLLTYNPQVHMPCWVTLKCSCHAVLYNTKKHGETSDKIWCIYLKIIKFYLISIFFELTFMMNSMRHWNCVGCGHTFNKVEFHVSIFSRTFILASRDVNMNLHSKKLIIFQI